ncbi:MAG: hypothetical protein PHI12_08540 [Dehalococcoidales bacterium]|nr:hypothetical protein [Dehalococcoidales bacterium]
MAWEQIGEGGNTDIMDVVSYENNQVAEGQRAMLQCEFALPVPTWQIDNLRDTLTFAGVEDLQVSSSGSQVNVTWRKGFAWAAVIIAALVVIALIIIWRMFKDVPAPVQSFALIGIVIAALAVVGVVVYKAVKSGRAP